MTKTERSDLAIAIQVAYADGTIDLATARARLINEVNADPEHADEILAQVDGESDVVEVES